MAWTPNQQVLARIVQLLEQSFKPDATDYASITQSLLNLSRSQQDYALYLCTIVFGNMAVNEQILMAAKIQLEHTIEDPLAPLSNEMCGWLLALFLQNLNKPSRIPLNAASSGIVRLLKRDEVQQPLFNILKTLNTHLFSKDQYGIYGALQAFHDLYKNDKSKTQEDNETVITAYLPRILECVRMSTNVTIMDSALSILSLFYETEAQALVDKGADVVQTLLSQTGSSSCQVRAHIIELLACILKQNSPKMNLIIAPFADQLLLYVLQCIRCPPPPAPPSAPDPATCTSPVEKGLLAGHVSLADEFETRLLVLTALRFFECTAANAAFATGAAVKTRLAAIAEHLVFRLRLGPDDTASALDLESTAPPDAAAAPSAGSAVTSEPELPLAPALGRTRGAAGGAEDEELLDALERVEEDAAGSEEDDEVLQAGQYGEYTERCQAVNSLTTLRNLFEDEIVLPLVAIFYHVAVCAFFCLFSLTFHLSFPSLLLSSCFIPSFPAQKIEPPPQTPDLSSPSAAALFAAPSAAEAWRVAEAVLLALGLCAVPLAAHAPAHLAAVHAWVLRCTLAAPAGLRRTAVWAAGRLALWASGRAGAAQLRTWAAAEQRSRQEQNLADGVDADDPLGTAGDDDEEGDDDDPLLSTRWRRRALQLLGVMPERVGSIRVACSSTPATLADSIRALAARLGDSNSAVQRASLFSLRQFFAACGASFAQLLPSLQPALLRVLGQASPFTCVMAARLFAILFAQLPTLLTAPPAPLPGTAAPALGPAVVAVLCSRLEQAAGLPSAGLGKHLLILLDTIIDVVGQRILAFAAPVTRALLGYLAARYSRIQAGPAPGPSALPPDAPRTEVPLTDESEVEAYGDLVEPLQELERLLALAGTQAGALVEAALLQRILASLADVPHCGVAQTLAAIAGDLAGAAPAVLGAQASPLLTKFCLRLHQARTAVDAGLAAAAASAQRVAAWEQQQRLSGATTPVCEREVTFRFSVTVPPYTTNLVWAIGELATALCASLPVDGTALVGELLSFFRLDRATPADALHAEHFCNHVAVARAEPLRGLLWNIAECLSKLARICPETVADVCAATVLPLRFDPTYFIPAGDTSAPGEFPSTVPPLVKMPSCLTLWMAYLDNYSADQVADQAVAFHGLCLAIGKRPALFFSQTPAILRVFAQWRGKTVSTEMKTEVRKILDWLKSEGTRTGIWDKFYHSGVADKTKHKLKKLYDF